MFCANCGKTVEDGARFCGNCGAGVAGAASVPTPILTASTPGPAAVAPAPAPIPPAPVVERSSKAPVIILVVFLLVMGVLGFEMMQFKKNGKKGGGVDVSVIPAQMSLKAGESRTIEATVTGAENTDVGWAVQEGSAGGSVAPAGATAHDGHVFSAGRYTAPVTPGTYHIIATSKADESRASSTTVTVQP